MTVATAPSERTIRPARWLERAFEIEPHEESYRVAAVEGELPGFLRGTYYLNGPALFYRAGRSLEHWLDGDGMVRALTFDGAAPRYRSRFVRSRKFRAEEEAGRFLYRAFGTAFAGDRLERGIGLASPVNVSVYPWAGRLLAFGEQGLPWELDPETLDTVGEHTFGGRLNAVSPFAAHPAFDKKSGEMYNFGVSFSDSRPTLSLYRFDPTGELVYRRRLPMERPVSVHDFALGGRWAVFHLSPY
ncbi:MAG: carotenoid oxygenase family protein, partial [Thermoanaerobaculia bacterium]|nr:carotenoid oxygenase family protein [Thermoanaerobaculia bacterium]